MTAINSWSGFSGSTLRADELSDVLFNPNAINNSFAVLHGGLNGANFSGSVPEWAKQFGANVCGFYQGTDRWEYTYAMQEGKEDTLGTVYAVHAALSKNFVLPWDARVCLFGANIWCAQNAAVWDWDADDGGVKREHFTLGWALDGTPPTATSGEMEFLTGATTRVPHGIQSREAPDGTEVSGVGDEGIYPEGSNNSENRYRFLSVPFAHMPETSSLSAGLTAGPHELKCFVDGTVRAPDRLKAKLIIPSCSVWMIAFRHD